MIVIGLCLILVQSVSADVEMWNETFEDYADDAAMLVNWTEANADIDLETGFGQTGSKCIKTYNNALGYRTHTNTSDIKVVVWVNTSGTDDAASIYLKDTVTTYAIIDFGYPTISKIGYGHAGGWTASGISFSTGQWYKVTIYANVSTNKWSAYEGVNGENVICENVDRFYATAANCTVIQVGDCSATSYFDDIVVTYEISPPPGPCGEIAYNSTSNYDLYSARYYGDTFEDAHGIADNLNLSLSNDEQSQYIEINSSCTPNGWLLTKKIDPINVTGANTSGGWGYLYVNKHDLDHGVFHWTAANENSLKVTVCDGWTNDSIAGYVDLTARNIDISGISIVDHPSLRLNFTFTSTGEALKDFRVDWNQTSQSNYDGIEKWWNNHTFASIFINDDCDAYPIATVRTKWDTDNHVHPFSCAVFAGKNIGNIESTAHYTWEVFTTSYGVSDSITAYWNTYTPCYNWMLETRQDTEAATTNSSRWSGKVISFVTPGYLDEDFQVEAIYDAGFRTGWGASAHDYQKGNYTYTWNNNVCSHKFSFDMNQSHEREASTAASELPTNKYDMIVTNPSIDDDIIYTFSDFEQAVIEVRDNKSLSYSWSHGYSAGSRAVYWTYITEIETYDDVWMTTTGEVYSYDYWRDHTIVTYNASESVTTLRIYNTEAIKLNDTRVWNVPLTFKFANINNLEGVNVYFTGNHTLYRSLTNISLSGLDHRIMQEGYTLDGTDLYVSTITSSSDKQIEITLGGGDYCDTPVISGLGNAEPDTDSVTIYWTTNNFSDCIVKYSKNEDLTSPYYWSSWDNDTKSPVIEITGLDSDSLYYYQAWAYDYTNMSCVDKEPPSQPFTYNFVTEAEAPPPGIPDKPTNPSPANESTNILYEIDLSWTCVGGETYDVWFGTAADDLDEVASNQTDLYYDPGTLEITTTYYWQIVAHNIHGSNQSDIWHFTTASYKLIDYHPGTFWDDWLGDTNQTINTSTMAWGIANVYISIMGNVFFIFLFGIIYLSVWIKQENVIIPTMMAFVSAFFVWQVAPVEFQQFCYVLFILGLAGVIFTFFVGRK